MRFRFPQPLSVNSMRLRMPSPVPVIIRATTELDLRVFPTTQDGITRCRRTGAKSYDGRMGAISPVPVGPPSSRPGPTPGTRWLRLAGLVGLSVLAARVPGSRWAEQTALTLANWLVTVAFAVTAVLLAEETDT